MQFHISAIIVILLGSVKADIKCVQNAVDMVFVIDSSNSIWPGNYDLYIKPFMKDVVNMFHVGSDMKDTRVGVVTFNNDYLLQFHLNKYLSQDSVLKGIDGIRFTTGDTFTHKALQYATNNMFTVENGDRSNIQNIMIVLTDGESNKPQLTKETANLAKSRGINIFAIGVGSAVKFEELKDMASEPTESFVYELDDFKSLQSIRNPFSERTCAVLASTTTPTVRTEKSTTPPQPTTTKPTTTRATTTTPMTTTTTTRKTTTTTTVTTTEPVTTTTETTTLITEPSTTTTTKQTTTTPELTTSRPQQTTNNNIQGDENANTTYCGGKPADIYFVLDSSSSVWVEDFNYRMLRFVRDIVDTFEIGPAFTRVGMVVYSDTVNHVFGLKSFKTRESLKDAIRPETVRYMSGRTNTAAAIKYVRETGFGKRASSARPDAAHVIVVITDGISQNPRATKRQAAAAKKDGAIVFAIGVGPYIDQKELEDIASDPNEKYVFNVKNYAALDSIRNLLAVQACKVIPDVPKDKPSEEKRCKINPTDVHFVYKTNMISLKERAAVKDVIRRFTRNEENQLAPIHMGITTDECIKDTKIPFSRMNNFRQHLNTLEDKQENMLYSLIKMVRRKPRNGRNRVMVIFIDDTTKNLEQVKSEAMRAKYLGFKLFVVAVGNVNSRDVHNVASSPFRQYFQKVDNYYELNKVDIDILSAACPPTALIRAKIMPNPYEGLRYQPIVPPPE